MKAILLACLILSASAFAADAPTLTDAQKLAIRDIQVRVAQLDAQKARLESQYQEVSTALNKASDELAAEVAKATPPGYQIQADLKVLPLPKKDDPKKDEAKKQ